MMEHARKNFSQACLSGKWPLKPMPFSRMLKHCCNLHSLCSWQSQLMQWTVFTGAMLYWWQRGYWPIPIPIPHPLPHPVILSLALSLPSATSTKWCSWTLLTALTETASYTDYNLHCMNKVCLWKTMTFFSKYSKSAPSTYIDPCSQYQREDHFGRGRLFLHPLPLRCRFPLTPVSHQPHDLPLGLWGRSSHRPTNNSINLESYSRAPMLPTNWGDQNTVDCL